MKKSLLQILIGVIIGGLVIVALIFLFVLQNSLEKKTAADVPAKNTEVITSTKATKLDDFFTKVTAGYKPERYYETDSAVWVGARSGLSRFSGAENDPTAQTLNLWRLSKSDWTSQFIGRFEAGGCDSVVWGLFGGELSVTHTQSPCEAGTVETQYVYDDGGIQKLKVVNSSFSGILEFESAYSAPVSVEFLTDTDCTKLSYNEASEESWKNPPYTSITQMVFSRHAPGQIVQTKALTFTKKIPSQCNIVYGGGYSNPGISGVEYHNDSLVFGAGKATTTIFLKEINDLFGVEKINPLENIVKVEGNSLSN